VRQRRFSQVKRVLKNRYRGIRPAYRYWRRLAVKADRIVATKKELSTLLLISFALLIQKKREGKADYRAFADIGLLV